MAGLYLERNTFFRIKSEYRQYYWQIQKKPCTTKTCIPRISWGFFISALWHRALCWHQKNLFCASAASQHFRIRHKPNSGIRRRFICSTELRFSSFCSRFFPKALFCCCNSTLPSETVWYRIPGKKVLTTQSCLI